MFGVLKDNDHVDLQQESIKSIKKSSVSPSKNTDKKQKKFS